MRTVLSILALLVGLSVSAQDEKVDIVKGNKFYDQNQFDKALESYAAAIGKNPANIKAVYNSGNATYRMEKFEDAIGKFKEAVNLAENNNEKAKAFHNLGNAYMKNNKLDEAIDAYKDALRLNPTDEETRYNLSYALKKKQNQDKNNKNNDQNKDENKDENKDNKDENQEKNKDKQDDKNKDGEGDNKDQKSPPPGMNPKQAEKLLNDVNKADAATKKKADKNDKDKQKKVIINSKKDW